MINILRYLKLKKSTQQYTTHKWLHLLQVVDWALDWQNHGRKYFYSLKISQQHIWICSHGPKELLGELFLFLLSGSTAERVCLAGDSAGGNLCITVSMKAISTGIRIPDGIMAAYPATLLTTDASPSRLLTLIDPLLPLGVLTKCINAYAGMCVCRACVPAWRSGVLFYRSFNTSTSRCHLTRTRNIKRIYV